MQYIKKQRGVTLVEIMIGVAISATLVGGGITMFNGYTERKQLEDQISTSSQQAARFSNAVYDYLSTVEGVESVPDIITSDMLINERMLPSGYSPITPFGHEIKALVTRDNGEYQVVITFTGGISDDIEVPASIIYRDTYASLLRQNITIPSDRYSFGRISDNQFSSVSLNQAITPNRDFTYTQDQDVPAIMVISEDLTPDLNTEIRVLSASPETLNPASGTHYSELTISIRNEDGEPVANEEILWDTNLGFLSNARTASNEDGVSTNRIYSEDVGVARVEARISDDIADVNVEFSPPRISLNTLNQDVNANDSSCFNVEASVSYPRGEIVSNEPIVWTVLSDAGNIDGADTITDEFGIATACITNDGTQGSSVSLEASLPGYTGVVETINLDYELPYIYDFEVIGDNVKDDGDDYYEIIPIIAFSDGEVYENQWVEWSADTGIFDYLTTYSNNDGEAMNRFSRLDAGEIDITMTTEHDELTITLTFVPPQILDIYYLYAVGNEDNELRRYHQELAQCLGNEDGTFSISQSVDVYVIVGYADGQLVEDYNVHWNAVSSSGQARQGSSRTNADGLAVFNVTNFEGGSANYNVEARVSGDAEGLSIDFSTGDSGIDAFLIETGDVNNEAKTNQMDTFAYIRSCYEENCEIQGNGNNRHVINQGSIYGLRTSGNTIQFLNCRYGTNPDCETGNSLGANSPHLNEIARSIDFPSSNKSYWTDIRDNSEIVIIRGNCVRQLFSTKYI